MIVINALATRAGGAAVRVKEVARRAPQSWRTGILLLRNTEAGIEVDPRPDLLVAGWPRRLERSPAVPRRVLEAPVLRRLLRDRQVEAVLHYGTYVPGRPVRDALNVLSFVSLAPWDPGPDARSMRNRLLRWLFERTHTRADLIVVQSEASRAFLQERYPAAGGRLAVVENGVSVPALRRARERTGYLLIGDVYRYRRIPDVVRAYARLDERIRAAHPLTIVGNAARDRRATADVMQAIAATNLRNVRFTGLLPRPKVLELMAASRVFVSFAAVENGPNALAEASTIGATVVLSDIPVHREFAGQHARFARDPSELVDAMAAAVMSAPDNVPELSAPVDTWPVHVAALGCLLAYHGALPDAISQVTPPTGAPARASASVAGPR